MLARIAYGSLFTVLLPALLIVWARRLDHLLSLPALDVGPTGRGMAWGLFVAALALVVWSMWALRRIGGGLPMNAFPPPRFVRAGPYAFLAHPIYLGFAVASAAMSAALGSSAGLIVVTPVLVLGSVALVGGYESHDLDRRFGVHRPRSAWAIPNEGRAPPTPRERAGTAVRILVPWLIAYEAIGHLPVPGAIDAMTSLERSWRVVPWTTLVYTSGYAIAIAAPLLAPTRASLRTWARAGIVGSILGFLLFLVLPVTAAPRPFDPDAPFGWLLRLERSDGVGDRAAFPSFHAFWAIVSAATIASRSRAAGLVAWTWGTLVVASCVTTGMHAIVDLVAGAALAGVALSARTLWRGACDGAERIADAWRAWRIGPARLLIHGVYASIAAGTGVLIIGFLVGDRLAAAVGAIGAASLVGAAIWGQLFVGSARLQRPFGYFGSVLGATIACLVVGLAGLPLWLLLAACAAAAPWIQALGRLRCLVQGCCHGAPTGRAFGIVHRRPESRVVALAGLGGVPIHPTPLYSIAANLAIGLLLARLWSIAPPASFLFGAYCILAGCARFVEESLRGEPHTPTIAGLRSYQWCSVALVIAGGTATCLASEPVGPPVGLGLWTAVVAALVAAAHGLAMGVDFPESTRPLSRLTPS